MIKLLPINSIITAPNYPLPMEEMSFNFTADMILHDCEYALNHHTPELQGESFRLSWWSIISMLRAVGNVLESVDGPSHPILKRIIKDKYRKTMASKPEPKIYWEFIKKERDNFLKKYNYGVTRQLTSSYNEGGEEKPFAILVDTARNMTVKRNSDQRFESFITDGPFQGRDEKEVAREAIGWWKTYIDEIREEALREYNQQREKGSTKL